MNLDRKNINLSQLRANVVFNKIIEALKNELEDEREMYEGTAPASEFRRGRVAVLKEILSELTNNATGKNK